MSRKQLLSILFTLFFIALFIWYGVNNQHLFEQILRISPLFVFLIVASRLLVLLSNGLFIKWTTEVFTRKMSTGEGFYIVTLSAVGNFLGPLLGGASIRAAYLKKVYKMPLSKFTSTLLGYYLILYSLNCIIAILALVMIDKTEQTSLLLLVFSLWLTVMVLTMFIKLPAGLKQKSFRVRYFRRPVKLFYDIYDGWRLIAGNKNLLFKLFFLAIISLLGTVLLSYFEFKSIGVSLSLSTLFLYSALIGVSLLVSFTPGAIGIRETILLVSAGTLSISSEQIIQVAVIDRGINFFVLFVLFVFTRISRTTKLMKEKVVEQ